METLDMNKISTGLWLGSYSAEMSALAQLKARGITRVLQLGQPSEMCPTHSEELEYMCILVEDRDDADLVRMLVEQGAFAYIREGIAIGSVLVHCQLGMSRSASAVIAYLMVQDSLTLWEALLCTIRGRKSVNPNPGFCRQLLALERCQGNLSQYQGPVADFLETDQAWLQYLDQAREAARVQ